MNANTWACPNCPTVIETRDYAMFVAQIAQHCRECPNTTPTVVGEFSYGGQTISIGDPRPDTAPRLTRGPAEEYDRAHDEAVDPL